MPQTSILDLLIPLLTILLSIFGVRKRAFKVIQSGLVRLAQQQVDSDDASSNSTVTVAVGSLRDLVTHLDGKIENVSQQARGDWEKLRLDLRDERMERRSDIEAVKGGLNNVSVRLLAVEERLATEDKADAP